ncbi:MAG: nucleotidyltransferase [Synergistaceae bacterium]|nr:HI0074 family nucleotidyltransferase substrate-binding subunit [Synergistota bacterium]NLM70946.1 nucleotidyltransferase [Synergistaceae bacterium]
MSLVLESLANAVAALESAILKCGDEEKLSRLDDITRNIIKAGIIQYFEFSYELCWKFMRRWIEMNVSPGITTGISRRELYRLAAEYQLISDVEQWMRYHHARNLASHTYEESTADEVYQFALLFSPDARRLLESLASKND